MFSYEIKHFCNLPKKTLSQIDKEKESEHDFICRFKSHHLKAGTPDFNGIIVFDDSRSVARTYGAVAVADDSPGS